MKSEPASAFRFIENIAPRLRWRGAVQGPLPGTGRGSRSAGTGEFDGHDRWCPGDDLARLDLRIWLRFRQRWTRRYRDDSSEPLTVIIDGGPSMGFDDRDRSIRWIRDLLHSIARCHRHPWQEWLIDGGKLSTHNKDTTPQKQQRKTMGNALRSIPPHPGGRGRVVIISDRLVIDDIETELKGLTRLGEPIWIAPLLPEEIAPKSWGSVQLEAHGEPSWTGTIDRSAIKQYQAEFKKREDALQRWLHERGGYHVRIDAKASEDKLLQPLLQRGGPLEVLSG
ncbi:MAG: DUF58 domain-containing protein [Planctomycetota bacterium]